MKKLIALTLALLIAAVVAYDIITIDSILYGNGRHKCGGSWVVSSRDTSWSYCDRCGEWHKF